MVAAEWRPVILGDIAAAFIVSRKGAASDARRHRAASAAAVGDRAIAVANPASRAPVSDDSNLRHFAAIPPSGGVGALTPPTRIVYVFLT